LGRATTTPSATTKRRQLSRYVALKLGACFFVGDRSTHNSHPDAQQGQYTSVVYGYIKSGKYASAVQILQAELQVRFRKGAFRGGGFSSNPQLVTVTLTLTAPMHTFTSASRRVARPSPC